MPDMAEMLCTIHCVSGESIYFKIEADLERQRNAASRIESFMESKYFGLEMDGKLTLIPMHNIQKVEISPPPKNLIAYVVKDAKPAG
jgi:hypothetical protein